MHNQFCPLVLAVAAQFAVPSASGAEYVNSATGWNAGSMQYLSVAPLDRNIEIAASYKKKINEHFGTVPSDTVAKNPSSAFGSTQAADLARTSLSGARQGRYLPGTATMHVTDHQVTPPLFITNWTKAKDNNIQYALHNRDLNWKVEQEIELLVAAQLLLSRITDPEIA